jgi:hypothetical protein
LPEKFALLSAKVGLPRRSEWRRFAEVSLSAFLRGKISSWANQIGRVTIRQSSL